MSMDVKAFIHNAIKPMHLMQGAGFAIGLYALIFLVNILNTNTLLKKVERSLSVESIAIERADKAKSPNANQQPSKGPKQPIQKTSKEKHTSEAVEPSATESLFEKSAHGPVPVATKNGNTVFQTYKKPFKSDGLAHIAIVIKDFGLSNSHTQNVLDHLPANISVILSPYANEPNKMQKLASAKGHEIWLELPLENAKSLDPGPKGIMRNAGLRINKDNLSWILSRTKGYAGVAGYVDNHLERSSSLMTQIFNSIFRRGIAYFEMNPDASNAVETFATSNKQPYIKNIYDMSQTSLKALERTAKEQGYAVGVIAPYPNNIRSLKVWAGTLQAKDLSLAPLSAVVK